MRMLFLLVCSFVQHEVVSSALSFVCELGFIVVGGLKLRGISWVLQCRGRCDECDLGRRTGEPERRCQPALEDVRHTVDRAITKPQAGVREAQRDHSSIIQCRGRCDECDLGRRTEEPERRRQPAIEVSDVCYPSRIFFGPSISTVLLGNASFGGRLIRYSSRSAETWSQT